MVLIQNTEADPIVSTVEGLFPLAGDGKRQRLRPTSVTGTVMKLCQLVLLKPRTGSSYSVQLSADE